MSTAEQRFRYWKASVPLAIELGQFTLSGPESPVVGHSAREKEAEMPITREAKAASGGLQLKPGMYEVTCMDVKEDILEESSYGTGEIIRFMLMTEATLDEDGNPVEFDAIANDKLTPKSKLTGWLNAFGVPVVVGSQVDIEAVVGKKAQAKIVAKLDSTGKDTGFTKVDDILPLQGARNVEIPIELMKVEEWWGVVRGAGISVKEGRDKAFSMFSKDPKDLTGAERKQVYESF